MLFRITLVLLLLTNDSLGTSSLLRTCYYPYEGDSVEVLTPDKLNVTLCTHIFFAFSEIRNGTLTPRNPRDVLGYKLVTGLKKKSAGLKVILSIATGGGKCFSRMVSSRSNRIRFINQSMQFARKYGFDGLDFDWEFPAMYPTSPPEDREKFATFLEEIREAAEEESRKTGRTRLSLSAAVVAVEPILSISYDVPKMAKALDFLNVMSYDYHLYHPFFPFTGHNSPLYPTKNEMGYFGTTNIAWTAKAWANRGTPKNKIVIGLPTYGQTFRLLKASKNGLNAPSVGFALGASEVSYATICDILRNGSTRVYDRLARVPYLYRGLDWVSYDDVGSITEKSKWVKDNGYGGVMTWSLMDDDWAGKCSPGVKFPLHTAIYEVLTSD